MIQLPVKSSPLALRVYRNHHLRYLLFGAVLCTMPLLASMGFIRVSVLTTLGSVLIYSIAALGLNLLLGYSGLISLGVAGFMGLGAYLAAFALKELGLSVWIAVLAAVALPTLIGLLVGLVSLRISGIYLAIATLCVSEILLKTFEEVEPFSGGMRGMTIRYPSVFGFQLNRESVYLILVVVLVLVMMLTHNLVSGQFGRALHAMRGSESAARAMGVNLLKYRLIVFALSTAYAGLAGALYVFFIRASYPTTWGLTLSLNLVAAIVVGGFRSVYGSVVGAFVIWAMSDLILKQLPIIGEMTGVPFIVTGILIIIIILFYPNGLRYIPYDIKRLAGRIVKRRKA